MDAAAAPAGHTFGRAGEEAGEADARLSSHFSLDEFTASEVAARHGIDNRLPERLFEAARRTAALLEDIRDFLGLVAEREIPLIISSGYRCLALNRLLGSHDASDHVLAQAADFRAPAFGSPYQVAATLAPVAESLGIGQLIHEFGGWVHVGRRLPLLPINRVITIDRRGTRPGILPARLG